MTEENPGVRPVPCSPPSALAPSSLLSLSGAALALLSPSSKAALQSSQPPANHSQSRRRLW